MHYATTHHIATDCYSVTLVQLLTGTRYEVTLERPTVGAVRGIAWRWSNDGMAPRDMPWLDFYNSADDI